MLIVAPGTGSAVPAGDTFGLVDPVTGIWHLYDGTQQLTQFYFGNPGDYPFMGDWDCNNVDTPGLYRQSDGYVYLRNSNSQGNADISFFFGNPGDVPIAGDFNADGCDTVSIYRPSNQTFYVINELGTSDGGLGAADYSYVFGNPGDKPFMGDFNGNGQDTPGLHRESTGLVYYRNTNTQGNADNQFIFGDPGDRFVAGDWTGDGIDTPGLFRPANITFFLRHENSQGNADESFWIEWSSPSWLPVAGRFDQVQNYGLDVTGSVATCSSSGIAMTFNIRNADTVAIDLRQVALFPFPPPSHAFFEPDDWWPLPRVYPGQTVSHSEVFAGGLLNDFRPGDEVEVFVASSRGSYAAYIPCS